MRRLILSVLLTVIGLASLNGVAANSSNESNLSERHREDIFNPAVAAAAFKVGLANVASNARSSNKRANAFGKQLHGGNNVEGSHRTKKNRRTPQVLGDLMGDDAHVVDENGVNVVLLEGGTITSGSVSTVRVVPTTYTTTSGGERITVTEQVTIHVVPTPSASPSSSAASSSSSSQQQSISSRTPIGGVSSSSSSSSYSAPSSSSSSSSSTRSSSSYSSSSSSWSSSSSSTRPSSSSSSSSTNNGEGNASSQASSSSSASSTRETSSSVAPTSSSSSSRVSSSSSPSVTPSTSSSSYSSSASSSEERESSSSIASSPSSSIAASSSSSSASPSSSSESSSASSSDEPSSTSMRTTVSLESSSSPVESSSSVTSSSVPASSTSPSSAATSEAAPSSDVESSQVSSSAASSSAASEEATTTRTPLVPASSASSSAIESSSAASSTVVESSESLSSATLPLASYDSTSVPEVTSSSPTSKAEENTSVFEPSNSGALAVNTTRTREAEETSSTRTSGVSSSVISETSRASNEESESTASPSSGVSNVSSTRTASEELSATPTSRIEDESSQVQPTPTDRPVENNNGTTTTISRDSESDVTTTRGTGPSESESYSSIITSRPSGDDGSHNETTTRVSDGGSITTTLIGGNEGNNFTATLSETSRVGDDGPSVTLSNTDSATSTRTANSTLTGTATQSLSTASSNISTTGTEASEGETSTSDLYAWVPTSALLANSAVPTTTETTTSAPAESSSDSEGDDDSGEGHATSTTSSFAPFPSEWPSVIVPTNAQMLSASSVPSGNTLISILFTEDLSWAWLCANGDASAQVFAFMPTLISTAINITSSEVITDKLVAYQPENYDGSTGTILSVYLGYIPTSYVDALSAAIKAPNSAFYTRTSGIPLQLSKVVNPTLPIMAYAQQGVSNTAVEAGAVNGSINDGNSIAANSAADKKKTIIIAVVTSIGVFLLAVLAFFAIKAARKSKGTSAAAANMRSPNMQNGLRGFQLQGDRNAYTSGGVAPMMQQRNTGGYGTNALSRVYGFAMGQQPVWATQQSNNRYDPAAQQNPFRISGYSDSSGSDQSHGSSAYTHSSDGNGNGSGYTPAHWTGPSHSHHYATQGGSGHNTSGRSSSIDFNSVDQDQVRSSWWRFSDGFGRAFSSPLTSGQYSPEAAASPISATSGRAHIRNSTRRVNIQRGPRGDLSGAISRPQMQENSLML
ncbi:hypothetical protein P389DRAFT_180277 [Cystobasidium minutum MCA 4210]|uniref:uncharacterized protein n=1 Tax=Cystobasidium minutum MCA 4210 TaxID=1397322 RepID=UPI0034CFDF99|eukprot:jgi/Rhomi1/180277/fgenesh1_pg.4_\